jgi:hypothetical protein
MQDSNNPNKSIDNLTNDSVNGNNIKGGNGPVHPHAPHFPGENNPLGAAPDLNPDGSVNDPNLNQGPILPTFDDAGNEIPMGGIL